MGHQHGFHRAEHQYQTGHTNTEPCTCCSEHSRGATTLHGHFRTPKNKDRAPQRDPVFDAAFLEHAHAESDRGRGGGHLVEDAAEELVDHELELLEGVEAVGVHRESPFLFFFCFLFRLVDASVTACGRLRTHAVCRFQMHSRYAV